MAHNTHRILDIEAYTYPNTKIPAWHKVLPLNTMPWPTSSAYFSPITLNLEQFGGINIMIL